VRIRNADVVEPFETWVNGGAHALIKENFTNGNIEKKMEKKALRSRT
jgi:hypothetical protein